LFQKRNLQDVKDKKIIRNYNNCAK